MNRDDVNTLSLMKMQLTIHFLWREFYKIRADAYILYIILRVSRFITRQRYFLNILLYFVEIENTF